MNKKKTNGVTKEVKKIQGERGITLIALVVTIVLLLILSMIAIRGMTGNDGLINVTETVAEDYRITANREKLEQKVRSIILECALRGEEVTLKKIAAELEKEDWIKSAVVMDDETIGNPHIVVTFTDGSVFIVEYDETYDELHIRYIGNTNEGVDPNNLPTIKAYYERIHALIHAEARHKEGIAKIELIYQGNIVGTVNNPTGEVTFDVSKIGLGLYTVRATSKTTGQVGETTVRVVNVSDNLTKPVISFSPAEPDGKNPINNKDTGWYVNEVYVTITTTSTGAKNLHYILTAPNERKDTPVQLVPLDESNPNVKGVRFKIENSGRTNITAWTDDGGNAVSENAIAEVKFDNTKPVINTAEDKTKIEATYGTLIDINTKKSKNTGWIISDGNIAVSASDVGSELNGYSYEVLDLEDNVIEESKYVANISTKIPIGAREGRFKVRITVYDKAGNTSASHSVTVYKDTVAPAVGNVIIDEANVKARSIPVSISSVTEETSGIAYYQYYADNIKEPSKNVVGEFTASSIYEIQNLATNTEYRIYAKVYDNAGKVGTSPTTDKKTKGYLYDPNITLNPSSPQASGWYTSDVEVTISDRAGANETRAEKIKYKLDGTESSTINGRTTTFTISTDGTHTLEAWMIDGIGEESPHASVEGGIKVDKTKPSKPTINVSATEQATGWYTNDSITISFTAGTDGTSRSKTDRIYNNRNNCNNIKWKRKPNKCNR